MMTDDVSKDDCWREALALLLRWQAAPDDEETRQDIKAFCALGDDHLAAWVEAKNVYRIGGMAVEAGTPAEGGRGLSRRQVLFSLGALALVGGGMLYRNSSTLPPGTTRTDVAEVREINLADGTQISAGPDTTFSVSFDQNQRVVELKDGLLYCSVAGDHRPFIVKTAGMTVACSSAILDITADGGNCSVSAVEGVAEVGFAQGIAADDKINPGDWIRIDDSGHVERGSSDPQQAGQWRNGTLVIENESVAAVIGRIARWQKGKVFIPQQRLASARVSGLYDLSDPLLAMQAVIGPHGGHVRNVAPWTVVLTTL